MGIATGIGVGVVFGGGGSYTYSAEHLALQAALTGTKPSAAIMQAQDAFIRYLKGNNSDVRNTWAKLACLIVPENGMPTGTDTLFWMNNPARKATLSATSPTYVLGEGYKGNGSSAYIDTTFNPSTDGGALYTQNACSAGFHFTNPRKTAATTGSGLYDGTNGMSLYPHYSGVNGSFRMQGAAKTVGLRGESDALWSLVRDEATKVTIYQDKNTLGQLTDNSTALLNDTFYLLAVRSSAGSVSSYMSDTVGLFYAGSNLDATDVKVINDAVNELIAAVVATQADASANITVGAGKDYATINLAIAAASNGNTITIDAGTYNESIRLRNKRLNLVGSGTLETIVYFNNAYSDSVKECAKPATLGIGNDSTITNIVIKKYNGGSASHTPVLAVDNSNPVLTDFQITSANGQIPAFTISKDSVVTITSSIIDGFYGDKVSTITDTSQLLFTGTKFTAILALTTSALADIDTDEWDIGHTYTISGDTSLTINVNAVAKHVNNSNGNEIVHGTKVVQGVTMSGNAYLKLSGALGTGLVTTILGAGNIVLYKDIVTTYGFWWTATGGSAATAIVTFDNCTIFNDCTDDSSGLHIFEDTVETELRIINGSVLTHGGHTGSYLIMGNPIVSHGKVYIRDSSVIDNCSDNVPFGDNYKCVFSAGSEIDIENATITNQNWDSVGNGHQLIQIKKDVGKHLHLRVVNCTLNNSEFDGEAEGYCIYEGVNGVYDADDYLCESGNTKNTTNALWEDTGGGSAVSLAYLKGNCPA